MTCYMFDSEAVIFVWNSRIFPQAQNLSWDRQCT